METSKKNNGFKEFLSKSIFYRVPKEEKEYVKNETMKQDYNVFRIMIFVILLLQIAMIIYKVVSSLNHFNIYDYCYLGTYAFLIITLIISYFITEYQYKNKMVNGYFITVSVQINFFFIWAVAISVIDSFRGPELTTFAYVSLALTAFVMLEPWVFILDSFCYSIALILIFAFIPDLKLYPSVIISALSVFLLTAIIGTVNFNRRVRSINLQRQVADLNVNLSSYAYVDVLTSIHNRRYLTERIDTPLAIGAFPTGVLMLDIDDFKLLNDTYGHQSGDNCLEFLGKCFNELVKKYQSHGTYAVRYGGEEFLIYFKSIDKNSLMQIGEELRSRVENSKISLTDGSSINITVSIGAAIAKTGMNYAALINEADKNLYKAKAEGKNRVIM